MGGTTEHDGIIAETLPVSQKEMSQAWKDIDLLLKKLLVSNFIRDVSIMMFS